MQQGDGTVVGARCVLFPVVIVLSRINHCVTCFGEQEQQADMADYARYRESERRHGSMEGHDRHLAEVGCVFVPPQSLVHTTPYTDRHIPGVALYFTGLAQLRTDMATHSYFAVPRNPSEALHGSTLPQLSSQGNLFAGATTRVAVGFILNPISILKARYEVRALPPSAPLP